MLEPDKSIWRLKQGYLDALLTGEAVSAGLVVDEGLKQGLDITDIYLKILIPTQRDLGHAWHDGKVNVAQEHLATQITLDQMYKLRSSISPRSKLGCRVVVTTVEGDLHFIGARMVADFFLADGWDVDFLGASTPSPDLIELLRRRSLDLVAISITTEDLLPNLEWTVESLSVLADPPKILLGGAAIANNPGLVSGVSADAFAQNVQDAVLEGRRLVGKPKEPISLDEHLHNLGQKIQALRKNRGMNQQQLADFANLDRTYISAVEHGKQNLTLGAVVRLADALGEDLPQLLSQSRS